MREELDKQLCEKFPDIFKNRNAPMNQTCMCWGFSCGDGWYPILEAMCYQIQGHINNRLDQIKWATQWNEELARAKEDDELDDWPSWKSKEEREIPEPVTPVVAIQVKEKFGTLRFYYSGGDDFVRGVVRMAESMSARMCEVCGVPATSDPNNGWAHTVCEEHK